MVSEGFFPGGGARGVFQYFPGGPKVVKFVFLRLEIKKQPFWLKFSKPRGAKSPPLPMPMLSHTTAHHFNTHPDCQMSKNDEEILIKVHF